MILYHATTPKKIKKYHESGFIKSPVRGFTTIKAAMAWAMKTQRSIILSIDAYDPNKLPDHHNEFGDAWWNDGDIKIWKCVYSAGNKL